MDGFSLLSCHFCLSVRLSIRQAACVWPQTAVPFDLNGLEPTGLGNGNRTVSGGEEKE